MGRKQKSVGELVMTRVFQIYIMEIINRLSTFCTLLQLSNTEHFLHPLLVFISIPTADTQIRFGSVALYQHFHTLIFVHTVSCSTRKTRDCSGLHALRICVGCQKLSFTPATLLQATYAVYSDMKWCIYICVCRDSNIFSADQPNIYI